MGRARGEDGGCGGEGEGDGGLESVCEGLAATVALRRASLARGTMAVVRRRLAEGRVGGRRDDEEGEADTPLKLDAARGKVGSGAAGDGECEADASRVECRLVVLRVQSTSDLANLRSRLGCDGSLDQLVRFEARRDLRGHGDVSETEKGGSHDARLTLRTRPSPELMTTDPFTVSPSRYADLTSVKLATIYPSLLISYETASQPISSLPSRPPKRLTFLRIPRNNLHRRLAANSLLFRSAHMSIVREASVPTPHLRPQRRRSFHHRSSVLCFLCACWRRVGLDRFEESNGVGFELCTSGTCENDVRNAKWNGRRWRTGSPSALDDCGIVDSACRSFVAVVDDRVRKVVERSRASHCENVSSTARSLRIRQRTSDMVVHPHWNAHGPTQCFLCRCS